MQLNLPSTLTSQKMSTLFLLSFFSVNKADAGQFFHDCLSKQGDSTSYPQLLNYFNSNAISSGQ
jgi:hypothetical protein